jgi:hypothetical protein
MSREHVSELETMRRELRDKYGTGGNTALYAIGARKEAALTAAIAALTASPQPAPEGDELLPCPFCGGEPKLVEVEPSGYVVECKNGACNASTNIRFSCGEDARPLVREQWNRRRAASPQVQGVDDAARALYMAGRWECSALPGSEQVRLWEALRDALGLPKGTATAAGVAAAQDQGGGRG